MSELAQAFNYVVTTMQADSALTTAAVGGVWQGFADIGTVPPYALVTQQANADTLTMNAVRLFNSMLLQIKAVGPASNFVALVTIADRIDALFGRAGYVTLTSGGVLSCYRESALVYDEIVNGAAWSNLGGLYRIALQGS